LGGEKIIGSRKKEESTVRSEKRKRGDKKQRLESREKGRHFNQGVWNVNERSPM